MAEYLFIDKSAEPTEDQLKEVLTGSYKYWLEIQEVILSLYGDTISEWKFYTKKTGWTRKTLLKKRNLFFFKPYDNHFVLTFVFGAKAVNEVEKSDVSEDLINKLLTARKYAEGRGLSVNVSKKADLKNIYKLIDIKINN